MKSLSTLNREVGEVVTKLGDLEGTVDKRLVAIDIRLDEGNSNFQEIEIRRVKRDINANLLEKRVKELENNGHYKPFPWGKLIVTIGLIATAITAIAGLLGGV